MGLTRYCLGTKNHRKIIGYWIFQLLLASGKCVCQRRARLESTRMAKMPRNLVAVLLLIILGAIPKIGANPDAKRLYDDLLSNYNRLIRPVSNNSEIVNVRLGLKLSQLIDLVSLVFNIQYCTCVWKLFRKQEIFQKYIFSKNVKRIS